MNLLFIVAFVTTLNFSCDNSENPDEVSNPETVTNTGEKAAITAVEVSGNEASYTFNVTIKSPDTGCQQYADWWEIVSTEGELIYRRILAHSHVTEQPFARTGGPVMIKKTDEIYIRAHMNTSGYGTAVFKGSVAAGFDETTLDATFAEDLAKTAPLPNDCAF